MLFRLIRFNIAILSINYSQYCYANDYFDPYSISVGGMGGANVDLSNFKEKGSQMPGLYQTDVYLNGIFLQRKKIFFMHGKGGLIPEISKQDIILWGVDKNPTLEWMKTHNDKFITNISQLIPDAFIEYSFEKQTLNISIPQKFLKENSEPYGAINEMDDGLNAFILNYTYSGSNLWSDSYHGKSRNSYINIRPGVNFGGWRIRNYSTYVNDKKGASAWSSINTYAQHDIKKLGSKFILGEASAPGDVFDSYSFRGVELSSDDRMQPENLIGFAPIVRGVAQSNAQITINQNGNVIWQNYVPPGPFEIKNLYPTSNNGDLIVTIKESSGTIRRFIQPFSSVPIMLREGRLKYAINMGQYSSSYINTEHPGFIQGSLIVGMPWESTLYGGDIISRNYNAIALGIGKSLGDLGAASLDRTTAKTKFDNRSYISSSFRFKYSKAFSSTGTDFDLAGYRYSKTKYLSFSEFNDLSKGFILHDYNDDLYKNKGDSISGVQGGYSTNGQNKRRKFILNATQNINDFFNIYVSTTLQDFWGGGKEECISAGFNSSINDISYTMNYSNSKSSLHGKNDQVYSLSVNIPFNNFLPSSWLNLSTSMANYNRMVSSVGFSGTALTDNNLSYNIQKGYGNDAVDETGNASIDYKGRNGEYQAAYSYSNNKKQVTYGLMGGVVVHKYGYSFSQPLGDTMALIKADNARSVNVINYSGVSTDRYGYAIVPYITPYRKNQLSLDTSKLPEDVDLFLDTVTVSPTLGALVLADYPTLSGRKILFKLKNKDIPFGALAKVTNGNQTLSGMVDNRGMVYLSGIPNIGTVFVTWQGGKCLSSYNVADAKKISFIEVSCK